MQNSIAYPALDVDFGGDRYRLRFAQKDFLTLGRVPRKSYFGSGKLFQADGKVGSYTAGSQRICFNDTTATILELLLIPALIFSILRYFLYFGPLIDNASQLSTTDFGRELSATLEREDLALIFRDKISNSETTDYSAFLALVHADAYK